MEKGRGNNISNKDKPYINLIITGSRPGSHSEGGGNNDTGTIENTHCKLVTEF